LAKRKRNRRDLTRGKVNQWADHYTHRAQKDRYPARSVYKLKEMQAKYNLIRPGNRILDLGCAPGSWLLFAAEKTGPKGCVVGIDIMPVTIPLPGQVQVFTTDMLSLKPDFWRDIGQPFDLILSDLAPATTGNKIVDTARSLDLCELALRLACDHLTAGGSFICKIFQGPDFKSLVEKVKPLFRRHDIFKPQSSRKASREIYISGLSFLGGNHVGT